VNRITERIETGEYIEGNRRIGGPNIRLWNSNEFRKCSRPVHADAAGLIAKMPATCQAIPAPSTNQVPLRRHQHTWLKIGDVPSNRFDTSNKLVTDRHGCRNCALGPRIPLKNVQIRAADRRPEHSDQRVEFTNLRHRDFL